jgi:hypothetical protein
MIYFIGGEKGGVGKSMVTRTLAQYFLDKKILFKGYDADRSHQTFLRFYDNFGSILDLESFDGLDSMVESFPESGMQRVVIDLAAQTIQPLVKWIKESDVLSIASELGIPIKFWHVMDDSKDSVHLLEKLMLVFQGDVNLVIVLNEGRGTDFSIFENSSVKLEAIERKHTIIRIPKLYEKTMQKIDKDNLSFWAACNNPQTALGLFERQRVKTWLNSIYKEYDRFEI